MQRRQFLQGMVLLPWLAACSRQAVAGTVFLNGHIDAQGQHYVSGFNAQGQAQFQLPLPDKAHGFAVNPQQSWQLVATPTLPGTRALVFDARTGQTLHTIHSAQGRHFNGHGCFSQDGQYFFSSENIAKTAQGVISMRDAQDFSLVRELPAYGIGPHDLRLLPDGKTLVIASGGIQTHPDSGKRELNINTMQSALLYIDATNGALLQRVEMPTARLSFRHMDVAADGTVLLACQYKGKRAMPKLVATHQRGGELQWLAIDDDSLWQMNQYTASARVAANGVAAVSCPRGNVLTLWDLSQQKLVKTLPIQDVGGLELTADGLGFIASANVGELYHIDAVSLQPQPVGTPWQAAKWTNHMAQTLV